MTTEMQKVDVLAVMDDEITDLCWTSDAEEMREYIIRQREAVLREARAAVAEMIERDKVAAQVFDCILRGVNDLSGPMGYRSEQFVAGWLKSWAKSLHAAGFKPSDPTATDIARALARVGGAA